MGKVRRETNGLGFTYESYAQLEKLAPMVREIGWTHNIIIMEKCPEKYRNQAKLAVKDEYTFCGNWVAPLLLWVANTK